MNEDVYQPARVDSDSLAWVAVGAGVAERSLEVSHGPLGVRTSRVVRLGRGARLAYPASTASTASTAPAGGIDLYVLSGTLEGPDGRYPAGTFVGLSPPERPVFGAPSGAVVFAKLRPTERPARVVVHTRRGRFHPSHTPGFWVMPLDEQEDGRVVLLRFDPGTSLSRHHHDGGEEFFVLDGAIRDEAGEYAERWWVRQPPGSAHSVVTERGCTLFTVAGHLG